jgi:hypothetical protein
MSSRLNAPGQAESIFLTISCLVSVNLCFSNYVKAEESEDPTYVTLDVGEAKADIENGTVTGSFPLYLH